MSALTNSGESIIQNNTVSTTTKHSNTLLNPQDASQISQYFQLKELALYLIERRNVLHEVTLQIPDEFVALVESILNILKEEIANGLAQNQNGNHHPLSSTPNQHENIGNIVPNQEASTTAPPMTDIEEFSTDSFTDAPAVATGTKISASSSSGMPHFTIQADTSYGSCCIDEITASKVSSQCLLHFGSRKCLQWVQSKELTVVNVPGDASALKLGKGKLDLDKCLGELRNHLGVTAEQQKQDSKTKIIVLYELQYWKTIMEQLLPLVEQDPQLRDAIEFASVNTKRLIQNDPLLRKNSDSSSSPPPLEFTHQQKRHEQFIEHSYHSSVDPAHSSAATYHEINGLVFSHFSLDDYEETEHHKFFYIGQESDHLAQIMLEFNACEFARYDPAKNRLDSASSPQSRISRMVRRRYFLTEKAKDVSTFGILIATVNVRNYMKIVHRIQKLLKDNDKQYYIFYVGKVNVPKLANFSEIEMFVVVSCGQNSLLDSKDYLAPMITPYELEVALGERQAWDGHIVTEFDKLLHLEDKAPVVQEDDQDEEAEPRFSLLTGSYVGSNVQDKSGGVTTDENGALVPSQDNYELVQDSSAAMSYFHQKRTFKGLEQKLGETPVIDAEQGLSGIPKNYESEKKV